MLDNFHTAILRGGLSIATALLLSTASFAQEATTDDPNSGTVTVQDSHDLNSGNDGTAVDPAAGDDGSTGAAAGDETATDPAVDPMVDVPVDDPDLTATDPVVFVDDGACVDGACTVDAGGDPVTDEGVPIIMYMNGGPDACIDCNVVLPGTAGQPGRNPNPSEVERTLTVAGPAPLAHAGALSGQTGTSGNGPDVAALSAATSMAQCLSQHQRSAWICEWQNLGQ